MAVSFYLYPIPDEMQVGMMIMYSFHDTIIYDLGHHGMSMAYRLFLKDVAILTLSYATISFILTQLDYCYGKQKENKHDDLEMNTSDPLLMSKKDPKEAQ
jgi:hypothetical protein